MIYEFDPRVVNRKKVDDFNKYTKFIGYILPDGDIFECKEHNVSDATSVLKMFLDILDNNYDNKNIILDTNSNNKLLDVLLTRLKHMSHDEIHALLDFINNNNEFTISDLLVSYFGCHLITRLDKEILTSEIDYHCFYNYLLNDFKIVNVGRVIYNEEKKICEYIQPRVRNEYLYDEINRIKSEVNEDEIELFYKGK